MEKKNKQLKSCSCDERVMVKKNVQRYDERKVMFSTMIPPQTCNTHEEDLVVNSVTGQFPQH